MNHLPDIEVSDKHIKLRIVAFVLALVIGVGAIGYGISLMGAKTPTYYDVEVTGEQEVVRLGRGFRFRHRFTGSFFAIRAEKQKLQETYTESLKRWARLLDPEERQRGLVNLAALNQSVGVDMTVERDLFDILRDAWERTRRGEGYNVFAGALYEEWNSILILSDPQDFDPLGNEDERARLETLAALYSDPARFALVFDEEKSTVRLEADPAALETLEELELAGRVLDLNLLRDAYLLSGVAADLEAEGYTNGYLVAGSGLTVSLSGNEGAEYQLFALNAQGEPVSAALAPVTGGSVFSSLRAFGMTEREEETVYGYYTVEDAGGETVYRHPNLPATGRDAGLLTASCVLGTDPAEVCYQNLRLWFAETPEALNAVGAALPDGAAWTLRGEAGTLHRNAAAEGLGLVPDGDYGWTDAA